MISPTRYLVDSLSASRLTTDASTRTSAHGREGLTLTLVSSTVDNATLNHVCRLVGTEQILVEPGVPLDATREALLDRVIAEWRELRSCVGMSTLDSDPERFVQNLIDYSGESIPLAMLFHEDGVLKAIIVAYLIERRAKLRLGHAPVWTPALQVLQVAYGGLIVEPDPRVVQRVQDQVNDLLDQRLVDAVRVRHVDEHHPLTAQVRAGIDGRWAVDVRDETHWFAQLADEATGERIVRNSAKTRSTLRRLDRRLVNAFDGDVEMELIRDEDRIGDVIEAAASIGKHSYQWRLGVGVRDTDRWRTRLGTTARDGRLRAYILRAGGEPIAYSIGDVYSKTCISVAMAFDHRHRAHSPGKVLLCRVFEALIAEGVCRFDFGFGDAEYKRLHGTESRQESTIMLFGRGWRPWLSRRIHGAVKPVNAVMHAALDRVNMLTRMKRRGQARGGRDS